MRLDAKCREIQQYGQQENKYVNRAYRRSGTLWEGRFRSCPVQEESCLLGCQRYIELNALQHRWRR